MKIRDRRQRNWFWIDNCIIRHYGRELQASGIAVYTTLCCHADNGTQESFPSLKTMADLLNLSPSTVRRALRKLAGLGLILTEPRLRPDGGQTSNTYILLNPPVIGDREAPTSRDVDPLPTEIGHEQD